MKYSTKVVLEMTDVIGEYIVVEKDSHDYAGQPDLCCGPSAEQESIAAKSSAFADTLHADFNQRFADQGQVLSSLKSSLTPILSAGPSQLGFSAAERAALESTALTGSAAANVAAQRAVSAYGAGRGGDTGLVSGIQRQLQAGVASEQAGRLAQQQLGITAQDYATGREQYWRAAGGLQTLAGEYAPTQYGQLAGQEGQVAFGEASKIAEMKAAKQKAIAGGITSLALDAATFGAGAMGGGGFSGGLTALAGGGFGGSGGGGEANPPAVQDPGFGINIPSIG